MSNIINTLLFWTACIPSEASDRARYPPCLIRSFAVHSSVRRGRYTSMLIWVVAGCTGNLITCHKVDHCVCLHTYMRAERIHRQKKKKKKKKKNDVEGRRAYDCICVLFFGVRFQLLILFFLVIVLGRFVTLCLKIVSELRSKPAILKLSFTKVRQVDRRVLYLFANVRVYIIDLFVSNSKQYI